jgi:hypothetical protein
MADQVFAQLETDVTALEGVVPSVVAIINGIADQIQAAVDADNLADSTKSAQLADRVRAQADALAAAAAANPGPTT